MRAARRALARWTTWTNWLRTRWGPTVGIPSGNSQAPQPYAPFPTDFSNPNEELVPESGREVWLPDPFGISRLRYWDGSAWTAWESNAEFDVRVGNANRHVIASVIANWKSEPADAAPSSASAKQACLRELLDARRRMRAGEVSASDYAALRQRTVDRLSALDA